MKTEYKSIEQPMNDQNDHKVIVDREYLEELKRTREVLWLRSQRAIELIKIGKFIDALVILEGQQKKENHNDRGRYYKGTRPSRRMMEVIKGIENGKSNKAIAFELGITEPTVKMHIWRIMKLFGATNRVQVLIKARERGYI